MDGHPLASVLRDAANGRYPATGPVLDLMPAPEGLAAALVAVTGRSFLAADLDEAEVFAQLSGEGFGVAMNPAFITWLGNRLGAPTYAPDVVLVAPREERSGAIEVVERPDLLSHPRAALAQRFRKGVRAYSGADGNGLLTLGLGLCSRIEVSIEVEPSQRNRGLGTRLAYAARGLAPEGEPVFAEVSPGNAASLRAFLAAGYVPIGSEVILLGGVTHQI